MSKELNNVLPLFQKQIPKLTRRGNCFLRLTDDAYLVGLSWQPSRHKGKCYLNFFVQPMFVEANVFMLEFGRRLTVGKQYLFSRDGIDNTGLDEVSVESGKLFLACSLSKGCSSYIIDGDPIKKWPPYYNVARLYTQICCAVWEGDTHIFKYLEKMCIEFFVTNSSFENVKNPLPLIEKVNQRGIEFCKDQLIGTVEEQIKFFRLSDIREHKSDI